MSGSQDSGREGRHNLFVLSMLAEKAHREGSDLFVTFVDFKKAYDSVDRDKLWEVLRGAKLGGK